MADPFIKEGIKYRIQNADFLTYVETPDYTDDLEMRPFKADEKQQWTFEWATPVRLYGPSVTSGTFYIRNVAQPTVYFAHGTLSGLSRNVSTIDTDEKSRPGEWKVFFENGSYYFSSSIHGDQYYIQTDDDRNIKVEISTKTGSQTQEWNLVPVSPIISNKSAIPDGNYRIRSFDGSNLLTAPNGEPTEDNIVFVKNADTKAHNSQSWIVTRQANGLYAIKSSGKDAKYLGAGLANALLGDGVAFLDTVFGWDLRSFGSGFAWSINVPRSQLSIGFASYTAVPGNNVSLQVSDTVPSQMWFFEKSEPVTHGA